MERISGIILIVIMVGFGKVIGINGCGIFCDGVFLNARSCILQILLNLVNMNNVVFAYVEMLFDIIKLVLN